MKIKFGTQLDEALYEELKVFSARARLPIGEVVQDALKQHLLQRRPGRGLKSGLARLLERPPLKISRKQFQTTMDEDLYDQ